MRITSKGQVTIPIEILRQAGLLPGTEIEFVVQDGNVVVRKAATASPGCCGQRLVESLRGRAQAGGATEEIMALTRARTSRPFVRGLYLVSACPEAGTASVCLSP